MSYDSDLRLRALEYAKEGHTLTQTAGVFKVNISTIIAWKRRYEATGDVKIKVRCPVNKKIIPEELIEYVEAHPDAYLKEIAEILGCHSSSVLKRLRKFGIIRKKEYAVQKQAPKQVGAYLGKIKDIPKKGSHISIKLFLRRRCTANLYAVNAESASISASAASAMLESGLLRRNVKALCLLRSPTAER